MTDHPIIYSAPMVQALLEGRKTMTRRLAWLPSGREPGVLTDPEAAFSKPAPWQSVQPSDRLWVREGHWRWGYWRGKKKSGNPSYEFVPAMTDGDVISYEREALEPGRILTLADPGPGWVRRPAIFHCRADSRLTLVVTATKIERLQSISEVDCRAEGLEWREDSGWATWNADGSMRCGGSDDIRESFRCLWINLHGAGAWEENPEVVALTFTVHLRNIDQMQEAA